MSLQTGCCTWEVLVTKGLLGLLRLWPWAGCLSSPPQGLSGPSGCLRLQMPAKLQEQEESKPEAPVLFSLPLLYPLSKANPILNPDASVKWEKGLPLFTGGADNYGHFIICSFGFFCKLLRNYLTNPIPKTHPGCLYSLLSLLEFPWTLLFSVNEYFLCDKPYFRSSKQNK